jgi:hypothetical protein
MQEGALMNPDPNRRRVLLADFIPVQRDGVELAANFDDPGGDAARLRWPR